MQNMGGRRTPDNLGYYGYNETLNAYYEVISYAKLLADAKKRNGSSSRSSIFRHPARNQVAPVRPGDTRNALAPGQGMSVNLKP